MTRSRSTAARFGGVVSAAALAVVASFAVFGGTPQKATADHSPANKTIARGSTIEFLTTTNTGKKVVPILSGKLRTSTPQDLILSVSAECALWTSTANEDSDASETKAQVVMWITIDKPTNVVPVTSDSNGDGITGDPDDGRVVFCNRAQRMETEFMDGNNDDTLRIREYQKSRTANAFNWLAFNLGNGIHTITLWAELDATVVESGNIGASFNDVNAPAAAAVGKRTLIVEPAKMANDATA